MNIAIVGSTGVVGEAFRTVLEEYIDIPITNIYFFASAKSKGKTIVFRGAPYTVEELNSSSFDRAIDVALFSAGGDVSKQFAPIAAQKGIVVIDNSSAWRMDESVPLVVPEVNSMAAKNHRGIIANPNCSTIQCVLPLKALHDAFGLKRVIYSSYQAVSGSGIKGINDLQEGIEGKENSFYPHPIFNNCIPQIDQFLDNGYTKEEEKMINETRKILNIPDLPVTATCVRVPVFNGHSVSVNVELSSPVTAEKAKEVLSQFPGITLTDDPSQSIYPLAINATGQDSVLVGRVRQDFSVPNGINFWCAADNIRKGAAANALQIARIFIPK
ncbi:MAG: aspartate-semialdehyde dehydrogenase [Brevinema sp.]